ncbi:MAG: 16S rRNA (uracil(1498)-N(3))-methyltransferase, partial [Elusimicrobia bacterium]|nr:16S rRNA (uracil(1498)-N(3))-methyltransferase [Elusimicrobiota bacterium]
MQFFLTHHHAKSNVFEISGGEAFHIAKVLRKKPGDVLRLFDGKGKVLWGKIERIASERVTGRIVVEGPDIEPLPFDIHVYQALPKGAKWDWVLEKGCELGVRRFVPLMTSRTVVQIARSEVSKKMARWRSVLQAAAKQSGSTRLPEIEEPKTFQEAIGLISRVESRESKVALFAWESETVSPVWKVLDRFDNLPETVSVFIGPEGGW